MRNNPTPSTGADSTAPRADSPSATLARIRTGLPSAVTPGPAHDASAARCSLVGGDPPLGVVRVGLDLDRAGRAVDQHRAAGLDVECTGRADDARDAELAGDDRGVAGRAAALGHQGEDDRRVESGGVGRREVGRDQHARLVGHGYAGLGLAHEPGHHPALDVAQVGDPLGHQAAHAGEDRDEGLDRGLDGDQQVVAGAELLEHPRAQPLVRARPALAVSTSAAAPDA